MPASPQTVIPCSVCVYIHSVRLSFFQNENLYAIERQIKNLACELGHEEEDATGGTQRHPKTGKGRQRQAKTPATFGQKDRTQDP